MHTHEDVTAALAQHLNREHHYPRPQLVRPNWVSLDGTWDFAYDDADTGLALRWFTGFTPQHQITVPYPPESAASGIGDTGFHRVLWYQRRITAAELAEAGAAPHQPAANAAPHQPAANAAPHEPAAERIRIHFGAVDYRCDVWFDGQHVGAHQGGHTPFSVDVTHSIHPQLNPQDDPERTFLLVVRVEDDPFDVTQPRGKQDWLAEPHVIWYHRTSGIWQTVWLERSAALGIDRLEWRPDVPGAMVGATVELSADAPAGATLRFVLAYAGTTLSETTVAASGRIVHVQLALAAQRNGQHYEELLWSPDAPRLIDALVELAVPSEPAAGSQAAASVEAATVEAATVDAATVDAVSSYLGLRSVAVEGGAFLLNDRPFHVRSVLNQGYWPESHLASPGPGALRREVELIRELGFNANRVHQKIEDPRFLFWADALGLLVWEELPSVFEFSPIAAGRLISEWSEAIRRDVSHPSIVTWVPINESWGVQHIAHDPQQQALANALVHLTKTLDPSRPVISNDGWEHTDSDVWSIHDYEGDGAVLQRRYADADAVAELFNGLQPAGRRLRLAGGADRGQPIMLTEFGGVKFLVEAAEGDSWGYTTASSAEQFADRVGAIFAAVHASRVLGGWCYTQLTDTLQEANGLLTAAREPKLPMAQLRALITGETLPGTV